MTRKTLMLLAAAGSLALIIGAWGFQTLGFAPCKLCLWQRWPHYAAIGIGAATLLLGPYLLLALAGALSALTTAAIGGYHTGVERGWWEGPTSCSGSGNTLANMSGADLLSLDAPVEIVMCDEVAWSLFGLSMASWNVIASLIIAQLWFKAMTRED